MNNKSRLTEYVLKRRKQRDNELKYDFMPSLLEIIERPSHMAGKVIIVAVALLLIFAICYASLSKVDVVVSGQGNVVGTVKQLNVNSTYSGKVSILNVKVGDNVKAGDVLIVLDTDEISMNRELISYEFDKAMIEREILGLYAEDANAVVDVSKYDAGFAQFIDSLILDNELYKKQVEQSYNEEVTILQRKVSVNQRMAELDDLIIQYKNKILQYDRQIEEMTITSAVDGYVAELNVSSVGENVLSNNTLLTIIPENNELIFEGYIADKDIGVVSVGDEVQIKLSAYSFSEYGAVYGKIKEISKNSKFIEGVGNVYIVKIVFDDNLNDNIKLEYGMSGSVEVIVGNRSLMDYFLEPIKKGLNNSLKEK